MRFFVVVIVVMSTLSLGNLSVISIVRFFVVVVVVMSTLWSAGQSAAVCASLFPQLCLSSSRAYLHLGSVTNLRQVANSFDEFDGRTVIDLGCGTVRKGGGRGWRGGVCMCVGGAKVHC